MNFNIVIVRLDRTIQNLLKTLDSPIKSGNDEHKKFKCLLSRLIPHCSLRRVTGRHEGSKTLLMQSLSFFDMVRYQMKSFRLNMISFRPQRCCYQAFASLMPACHFVEMDILGSFLAEGIINSGRNTNPASARFCFPHACL